MKQPIFSVVNFLPVALLLPLASTPAIANEAKVPLVKVDEYAYRSVTLIAKDGKEIKGCDKLLSYEKIRRAIVCDHVSGIKKSYLVGSIQTILFSLITKQSQGMVAQQAIYTIMDSKPREKLHFAIPEQMMEISAGSILLNSSWMLPPNAKYLTVYSNHKGKVESTTILEPLSLTYQPAKKTFLLTAQYVDYTIETKRTMGTGGGGKGGGRSRLPN
jgi:hypothetical protein